MKRIKDLKIAIVPSVAINGAILPLVTIIPFKAPQPIPIPRATRNPINSARGSLIIFNRLLRAIIIIPPLKATALPTDRSIPPAIIINVIPKPIIPVKET